jgi:hypothetical protein
MAELGEPVAIGVISDEEWKCPFAHEKPGKVDNDLGNSSEKLGSRVTNGYSTQLWADDGGKIVPKKNQKLAPPTTKESDCPKGNVQFGDDSYPFSVSAHHLIPADASLPNSSLIDYIKAGDKIWGDIGYDVNGAENGLWLPTHSSLSTLMKKGKLLPNAAFGIKYGELADLAEKNKENELMVASFHQRYTYLVMDQTGRQFHDAHTDYSDEVVKKLDSITVKLLNISAFHCDKCKEAATDGSSKLPPPHTLVFRLNALSRRLAGFLWGNPLRWAPPWFTSRFAASLAADAKVWESMGL